MLLKRFIYTTLLIFILPCFSIAQNILKGVVSDSETSKPLVGANIVIKELNRGTSTNQQGQFQFEKLNKGDYTLRVSYVGYHDQKFKINLTDEETFVEINMVSISIEMEKVMITATRTERKIEDLAGQNEIIEKEEIEEFPTSNSDDILQSIANINVNR
ncbi:MAG TPA: carboxypeptidase-like regulatory domain-containing protein, partial [Bacteroidales bacterium]|nr:carboxypeptidase-like regulatory domain-containing protein [Bacteroidales bacterium]